MRGVHEPYMNFNSAIRPRHGFNVPAYPTFQAHSMFVPTSVGQIDAYQEPYMDNRFYPYSYPYGAPMSHQTMPSMPALVENGCHDTFPNSWDPMAIPANGFQNRPSFELGQRAGKVPTLRESPRCAEEGHLYGPGPPIITGSRVRGPRGANLFCFHLPNEMTNWDLYLLFRRFGTILSVHTMINKQTGLSRGFGFVSFQDPNAADEAMKNMN
eukprot:gene39960-52747_t